MRSVPLRGFLWVAIQTSYWERSVFPELMKVSTKNRDIEILTMLPCTLLVTPICSLDAAARS
jgi:hypothetical protein